MRVRHDLGSLEWTVAGWTPYVWRQQRSIESGISLNAEVPAIPASVPGSVQAALRAADLIPDWNVGLKARDCEWVENRHWIYTARVPAGWLPADRTLRLIALGLDYSGWILLNGREIGRFTGSLVPHCFDLSAARPGEENVLQIVFAPPPRWLGQIGYTSEMTEWKPRFNYFWDWTSRLVQIGIWDELILEVTDEEELIDLDVHAEGLLPSGGRLRLAGTLSGRAAHSVQVTLEAPDQSRVRSETFPASRLRSGAVWEKLPVEHWWPNGSGEQPLYVVRVTLLDAAGAELDERTRRVGFRRIDWLPCADAPPAADPWLCAVNGKPTFLQGVNWTPILPNFADVTDEQYRHLLQTYRDLGCNVLRVWGGAFLERSIFYDLCDELGLLVWQEFPLSSSGLDNWPPESLEAVEDLAAIAASYIKRRRHHASLLLWSGGNELQGPAPGGEGKQVPVDLSHPLIARLAEVVAAHDPGRRFVPSSPSGPSFGGEKERFGTGVHWDVHGPWHAPADLDGEWTWYWSHDDALFRSEVGVSGASPTDIIRTYKGDLPEVPGTNANPLWRRTSWWIEWPLFVKVFGREPESLEEYVRWSQQRQADALAIAAGACRDRFPRCGGFIVWMGHDSFPCTANTAVIDFWGRSKPAALALGAVYRGEGGRPLVGGIDD